MQRYILTLAAVVLAIAAFAEPRTTPIENVVVIKEADRFSGWPANRGIWSWGDEILVGFVHAYYAESPTGGHDIDRDRPSQDLLARSMDGGETWTIEERTVVAPEGDAPKRPYNFEDPDLALNFRGGEWFASEDRGKTWVGPYNLVDVGRPGLLARTDYIVEGKRRVTAFMAAEKTGGGEGQAVCIRTEDGGKTWEHVGWIGPEPPEDYGYAIMPATVSLGDDNYLSFIRRGGRFDGEKQWWIEPYLSPDDGESWYLLKEPRINNAGNPATLTRLENGDLALAYGWRLSPYGLRARVSTDNGITWSPEIALRADGASWDIGYPRTVQRADGKCVTVYYYHLPGETSRHIAATIWDPAGDYVD
jgi:hypothetical protein